MTHDEQIETIMDYFDFHKVHKAMIALEWKWFSEGDVPSVPKLRQQARNLLRLAAKQGADNLYATGGFEAKCDAWNQLSLKFVVEQFYIETD